MLQWKEHHGERVSLTVSLYVTFVLTFRMLIFGRIIAGLGYGYVFMECIVACHCLYFLVICSFFYTTGPVYIAEIAPKNIRGSLTSLVGFTITLGILCGNIANILLFDKSYGWRASRLIDCILCCVYVAGLALVPMTPR